MVEKLSPALAAAHAASRFGLGAKPDTLRQIGDDAPGWVRAQISQKSDTGRFFQSLPTRQQASQMFQAFIEAKKERKEVQKAAQAAQQKDTPSPMVRAAHQQLQKNTADEILARFTAGVNTSLPLQERMLRFWSNHFSVSVKRAGSAPFVGLLEREAIRPHLFGRFEDMLRAVTEHPAMLFYLDNAQSIGPNSLMGERRGKGLNENLAREIMELHTLGVDGGYTQSDVTSFAKVITGWSVVMPRMDASRAGDFFFNERGHEPEAQIVLGRRYAATGKAQGDAVLHDLAQHPATAQHLATKLARHFIADEPPREAVARLAAVFQQSGGDLAQVMVALVAMPETWGNPLGKVRDNEDYLLAITRALGVVQPDPQWLKRSYDYLGQTPYTADSPAGWGDKASDWAGPDLVMKRINLCDDMSRKLPASNTTDLVGFGQLVLGGLFSNDLAAAMTRAATRPQALALLLASPAMMRR